MLFFDIGNTCLYNIVLIWNIITKFPKNLENQFNNEHNKHGNTNKEKFLNVYVISNIMLKLILMELIH